MGDPVNKLDPGGNETYADGGSSWPDRDDPDPCKSRGSCRGQDAIDKGVQAAKDDPLGTAGAIAYEISPLGAVDNIISGVKEGNKTRVLIGIVETTPWGKVVGRFAKAYRAVDDIADAKAILQVAATDAARRIGSGKGPIHGTLVHSESKKLAEACGFSCEVS